MDTRSPSEYIEEIKLSFLEHGNTTYAEKHMAYLKNHFNSYGLKAKEWGSLLKIIIKKNGTYKGEELNEFIRQCFEDEYREIHYAGIIMMEKSIKKQPSEFIDMLEWMITHNSWWDSVDWIAKYTGMHFVRYPELVKPYTEKWISSDNMWLQRVAIIFQLFYREQTDEDLLFDYCRRKADDPEFFIRKAIGWALRQHTKTNPTAVIEFVQNNQLSNLSKKEALRLLDK